ncbi:MAG: hypothetical protein L0241_29745 [Planctomycetia bacterium]|nr:hypothetical protein [Planctomycetia bacterium]
MSRVLTHSFPTVFSEVEHGWEDFTAELREMRTKLIELGISRKETIQHCLTSHLNGDGKRDGVAVAVVGLARG